MNIHVVRPGGDWYSRPDVTLVRDADLFCLPDDCTGAQAFRACCIRIEKAGKAIAPPFARRYFNSTADSILFYGTMPDGTLTPYLDRSTWVSRDFHPSDTLDETLQARIIQALKDKPLPKELLEAGCNGLEGDYYRGRQSLGSRAGDAASELALGNPIDLEKDLIAKTRQLAPEDLQKAARTYFASPYEVKLVP